MEAVGPSMECGPTGAEAVGYSRGSHRRSERMDSLELERVEAPNDTRPKQAVVVVVEEAGAAAVSFEATPCEPLHQHNAPWHQW